MTAGIPGIGLGALFYVISTLLMLVVELYRTIRGRSSLARWRFVGRQAATAAGIVLTTATTLWLLHLAASGVALDAWAGSERGTGAGAGPGEPPVVAFSTIWLSATPVLGTFAGLTLVLCLAETLRWVAGPPRYRSGSLGSGESLPPEKRRAASERRYR
jgi:hypothetical protein